MNAETAGDNPTQRRQKIDLMSYDGAADEQMPDVGKLAYLVGCFADIGISTEVVAWTEMQAWQSMAGVHLSKIEAMAIMSLSRSYVYQYHRSNRMDCASPCDALLPSVDEVSSKVECLFAMLRGAK